jgi:hypothetical protein
MPVHPIHCKAVPNTIISLTTIPPRMPLIGPTIESLLSQDVPIDKIILWVPENYRRKDFNDFELPRLPEGVELQRCPIDYGPATKILPAVQLYRGQDVRIIYCDDDRIYFPDWARHLLAQSDLYPDQCIAEAGEVVEVTRRRAFGASLAYRALTLSTLGIFGHFHRSAIRALDPGFGAVDICKGCGGVLIRPEFLPPEAFEIPDLLWTVDDIWLSGQLALNGVKIRKVAVPPKEKSRKTEVARVGALVDYSYQEHSRDQANMACISYFQETRGIWLP